MTETVTTVHWTGRIVRRGLVLSRFVAVQGCIQALTVTTGVVVVRALDKNQYAAYTLAAAMLTMINVLADGGLGAAMFAIGSRIWRDQEQLDALLDTAMSLRFRFGYIALLVVLPVLGALLYARDGTLLITIALMLCVAVGSIANFSLVSMTIALKLEGKPVLVQRADLLGAVTRLLATLTALAVSVAAVSATIGAVAALWLQRTIVAHWEGRRQRSGTRPAHVHRKEMLGIAHKQLPQVIYFALQGQLTILVIGIFGTTSAIADIGAIARIAIVFTTISSVVNTLVIPSIARCDNRDVLRQRIAVTVGAYCTFCLLTIVLVGMFPGPILTILGSGYQHLGRELLLLAIGNSITGLGLVFAAVNIARGWVGYTWLIPPLTITVQCVALLHWDVSRPINVIMLSVVSSLPALLAGLGMTLDGFARMPAVSVVAPRSVERASALSN